MQRFARERKFSSWSVQDLLEAREHYRLHLCQPSDRDGSAISRYRIRKKDKNAKDPRLNNSPVNPDLGPRTLANSAIFDWSWPAVLVFVNEWLPPEVVAKHPEKMVPAAIASARWPRHTYLRGPGPKTRR
jgi:hypothetical protein